MNPTVKAIKLQVADLISPYINFTGNIKIDPLKSFWPNEMNTADFHKTELPKIRQYYQFKYPQYPFLTEGDIREICYRHGLAFGYLPQYVGGIPERNKKAVTQFQKVHLRDSERVQGMDYLIHKYRIETEARILYETRDQRGVRGIQKFIEYLASTDNGTRLSFLVEGGSGRDISDRYGPVITLTGWGSNAFSYLPLTENLFLFSKQIPRQREEGNNISESLDFHNFDPSAMVTITQTTTSEVYLGLQLPNFHTIVEPVKNYRDKLYDMAMYHRLDGLEGALNRLHENAIGNPFNRVRDYPIVATENLVYIKIPEQYSFYMTSTGTGWGSSNMEVRVDLNGLNYAIRELYQNIWDQNITDTTPALKIIAPPDQFLQGLDLVDFYRLRFSSNPFQPGGTGNDPIILQPVKYGYLMLTQWGDDVPGGSVQNPMAN